ncbi:uncharacterized protein ASCRUDRAFT_8377 [Ascoidea rubescens DSM 1968]|uniref:Uncharacterized protein n=1 Tax=Ascoidea rubescens DSM 1968 TaxID=1344418 RepID=A0A1D2VGJ0_9ASCO|nr:hypothetical protein ASCRUDRAFT_8377 [Ascoidea rubescens DSM 1968]ODV60778.1 hypothetical protein ASCRUDRAFT_8377 [Ascoidea rubescens DSM 1968]
MKSSILKIVDFKNSQLTLKAMILAFIFEDLWDSNLQLKKQIISDFYNKISKNDMNQKSFLAAFSSTVPLESEQIIIKIFDPFDAKSKHEYEKLTYGERIKLCYSSFKKETHIYEVIKNHNMKCESSQIINIPTIYQTGCLMINSNYLYEFCGLYIAMQYLGDSKLATESDFKKGLSTAFFATSIANIS